MGEGKGDDKKPAHKVTCDIATYLETIDGEPTDKANKKAVKKCEAQKKMGKVNKKASIGTFMAAAWQYVLIAIIAIVLIGGGFMFWKMKKKSGGGGGNYDIVL
jgi:hypothetical protein